MTRVQGGCAICRRIWALLQIHARQCRRDACMVPKCRQLKEQLRALAQQQAQMDERRRAAMNAAYRRCVYSTEANCTKFSLFQGWLESDCLNTHQPITSSVLRPRELAGLRLVKGAPTRHHFFPRRFLGEEFCVGSDAALLPLERLCLGALGRLTENEGPLLGKMRQIGTCKLEHAANSAHSRPLPSWARETQRSSNETQFATGQAKPNQAEFGPGRPP